MKFVSLNQAIRHLRVDTDDAGELQDLDDKIEAASIMVARFIQNPNIYQDSTGTIPVDSSGDPIGVDKDVQMATLILAGIFYRDRDGTEMDKYLQGYLPFAVTALIYPFRVPVMA
jgi:hypothetical protein